MGNYFTPISLKKEALTPKELAEIQKENHRLDQEVAILKNAMAIFTKKLLNQNSTILSRNLKINILFRKCAKYWPYQEADTIIPLKKLYQSVNRKSRNSRRKSNA